VVLWRAVLCRYRKLFVLFSSYTYVNRLQPMHLA
jgi:hypothetical protein